MVVARALICVRRALRGIEGPHRACNVRIAVDELTGECLEGNLSKTVIAGPGSIIVLPAGAILVVCAGSAGILGTFGAAILTLPMLALFALSGLSIAFELYTDTFDAERIQGLDMNLARTLSMMLTAHAFPSIVFCLVASYCFEHGLSPAYSLLRSLDDGSDQHTPAVAFMIIAMLALVAFSVLGIGYFLAKRVCDRRIAAIRNRDAESEMRRVRFRHELLEELSVFGDRSS